MNKKIIIFIFLILTIIAVVVFGIHRHIVDVKSTKENNDKRYFEIKESAKKAVEWNIKAMYPNCPITDTFDDSKNANSGGRYYNSSLLISNGYINKHELLDVDGESYCDVYVVIKAYFEDQQDHQKNCSTAYKIYLKCKNYEDKGYINWEK